MNSNWLKWILAGGALLAVPVLVGVYGVSIVQASTPPTQTGSTEGAKVLPHLGFGERAIDMQALLAEALGISVEELEAAQQAAFEAAVAIALDKGMLTQEQADQILEGDHPLGPRRGFGLGRGRFGGELPEGFEPGEGFGPGRGRWHPFGSPDKPQEDTSNTTNA